MRAFSSVLATVLAAACMRSEAPSTPRFNDRADSLYARGAYDSAQALWTSALGAPAVRGTLEEARLIANLALVAYRRGDYRTARVLGDSALGMRVDRGASPRDLAESRVGLGLMAWGEDRLADATLLFEQALADYRAAGDASGVAKAASNLGLVAVEYGRFAEARERFTVARSTGKAIDDARIAGRATTNLAMVELTAGDPHVAVGLIDEARTLARRASDPVNDENALGQLSLVWAALGDIGRALATADSALVIARRHAMRDAEASDLLVLATLFSLAGDPDRAIQQYVAARTLYDSLELSAEAATVLRHEALLRVSRGAFGQARRDIERALTIHREADTRLESFFDLLALAHVEVESGNPTDAARAIADAARTAADFDGPNVRAALALARARVQDARHESAAVLATVREAARDLATADAQSTLDAAWLQMRAYGALDQLDSALAAARRTEAAIDQVGSTLASLTLRMGYRTERHRVVADVVLVLLRAGASEEAFRVAESVRGDALRAEMARARGRWTLARPDLTNRERAERERILREIDALVMRLAELGGRPRPERGPDWTSASGELARRIRESRARYEALVLKQTEAAGPAPRQSVDDTGPDVDAVRSVLHSGEALVEYYVTADTLVTFTLTHERLRVIVSPIDREDLDRRVRLVRGLLGVPGGPDHSVGTLEALYSALVGPLVANGSLTGARRLLIVAHGALSHLPFAVLRNPVTAQRLVDVFAVTQLPTSAMLPELRRADRVRAGSTRMAVFAPFPDRLPATQHEAAAVAGLVPDAIVHRGPQATEAALRRALAMPGRVHIASHGEFNPSTPSFSSVVLEHGRGGSHDDGRLESHEVVGLPVRSGLVFLSGCETAMGSAGVTAFERAEDVTTLSEAFVLAGARGVVATLWRIDDDGAAHFAERFYARLAAMPAAEALAAAQRDLIREPRWSHPYYWAGYTLTGDPDPLHPGKSDAGVR